MFFQKQFIEIAQQFNFFLDYGTLCPPDSQQTSFPLLKNIAKNLPKLLKSKSIQKTVQSIPTIDISLADTYQKKVQLRLYLVYIMNSYLIQLKDDPIKSKVLPKQIAVPLYTISKQLGMKLAQAVQIGKIWKFKQKNNSNLQNIKLQDLELVYTFSGLESQQAFILGSVIGALILKDIIISCYQINKIIESQNQDNEQLHFYFKQIIQKMLKLNKQVVKLYLKINPSSFFNQVIIFFFDLKDVLFQGIQIKLNQTDSRFNNPVTCRGANGGNDPSFQMFQRLFGIEFTNNDQLSKYWINTQNIMAQGMPTCHINLINKFKNSKIRKFCEQNIQYKEYYNKIIDEYTSFFKIHMEFIQNYIFKNVPGMKLPVQGTAAYPLLKYRLIEKLKL